MQLFDGAEHLTSYLAEQLGIERSDVCQQIGLYWQEPRIRPLQPHNLVGHAFRSLVTNALQLFGDQAIVYEEEVHPHVEFPHLFVPVYGASWKIDVVARREGQMVAILGVSWRVRYNRLAALQRALAYSTGSRKDKPNSQPYAVLGEFDSGRLRKLLNSCPPINPHAAISAAVHFAPQLIRDGLEENGTLEHLRSLAWLIAQSFHWK